MPSPRDLVPAQISALLGGRPTRWVPASRLVGDYDGRDRTLEVFDADAREQRALLRRLRPLRAEFERQIGGPLIVLFHTPSETARLYPEVRSLRRRHEGGIGEDLLCLLLEAPLRTAVEPSPTDLGPDPGVADPAYEEAA
jgi:hypothetical protein